jgi:hypothetical protein
MKLVPIVLAAAGVLVATSASAQLIDLSGRYRCVQNCRQLPAQPAFVTQNGTELTLVNEAGEPSRGWFDWRGHIWAAAWNQGAIYSPDGLVIQFDSGTVWQRELEPAPVLVPVPRLRGRRVVEPRPVERAVAARDAYDGSWSVLIATQAGPCDPTYRFGVQIINGNIVYEGGGAGDAQGQVAPNGAVWVHVAAAGNAATGEGRLSRAVGSGTWRGQGPGGQCSGIWQASRRG